MFFKRKTKAKIYIGEIIIAPRFSTKNFFSTDLSNFEQQQNTFVEEALHESLNLPLKSSRQNGMATDRALDIIVTELNFGAFEQYCINNFNIPILWRPSISLTARLYSIDSDETIFATTIKHTVSWFSWIANMYSLKKIFSFQSQMTKTDIDRMTIEATLKLLTSIQKNI
ncbi:hypothetical protein GQR58_017954 [Nymphon striatum]|nr:hypothetical protein GQR58_017954 [Nymphon striatum]